MNLFVHSNFISQIKYRHFGLLVLLLSCTANVQAANPFLGGWTLSTEESSLTFQTIKNGSKLETSSFANFQGEVSESGEGEIRIQLDSVDTKVDLRNVRMRFLFFETFKFREAIVKTSVNPEFLQELDVSGRVTIPLTFVLDLHGVSRELEMSVVVTKLASSKVSIASASPISIATELFDLDEGVRKLEEAANVSIVPMGSVSFNLVFKTNAATGLPLTSAPVAETKLANEPVIATSINTALEPTGNLNREECVGRFEILSRTEGIYFKSGSAVLDPASEALLDTLIDIIERCAELKLVIAGHTDSVGDVDVNQWLSEKRAEAVERYLSTKVTNMNNIRSTGFGELMPIAPNDTPRNRRLNRRIEILVDG